MISHKTGIISESEEMYLITIARMIEEGAREPVAISRMAERLSIQPVSANQMVHKLVEEGLVAYRPYKGVKLSEKGVKIASSVLRRRRLWEVFLVEHLGIMPAEADALACRFEHITPKSVITQLDDFLDHPAFDSQGSPIPADASGEPQMDVYPLLKYPVGSVGQVVRIDSNPVSKSFLDSVGLKVGVQVLPLAQSDGGPMLLKIGDKHVHLAAEVIETISVRALSDKTS